MIRFPIQYIVPGSKKISQDGSTHATFMIPIKEGKVRTFRCLASVHKRPGLPDLEHVSVAGPKETPRWETMCVVKDLFWEDEDEVIQYHPKKSQYINMHPRTLHLWREASEQAVQQRVGSVGGDSQEVQSDSVCEVSKGEGFAIRDADA